MKSLAAGADAVTPGNLLAGADEAPGNIIKAKDLLYKVYRGDRYAGFHRTAISSKVGLTELPPKNVRGLSRRPFTA